MLRFLLHLPEPIIPISHFNHFRQPLEEAWLHVEKSTSSDSTAVLIQQYRLLMSHLPPLNIYCLLYLLDFLAMFAEQSDHNRMTIARLAAIFQPAILSPVRSASSSEETTASSPNIAGPRRRSYALSQDVVAFLIENHDSFVFLVM